LSVFLVLLSIALSMQGRWSIDKGEFADSDCYTHLKSRGSVALDTGNGMIPYWRGAMPRLVRIFTGQGRSDVLLLTGAWLLNLWRILRPACFWCGVLISPLLLIASLVILPWAFRPILADHDSNQMRLLFIFQLGIVSYYSVERPDHHSLLGFAFIISAGLILRVIPGSFNKITCYIAGMVSAFSLWIHVESLLVIFLNIILLGIFWIFEDEDLLRRICITP